MLSESELINSLKTEFPNQIGDDAAVLPFSEQESYVITKDLLVEDLHFRLKYQDPISLAYKALHVNLSDIAAMGAKAQFVLLGIAIPMSTEEYIHQFVKAFAQACKEAGVYLIGGDTTKSPDKLFISVTAIGIAPKQNLKYRHTGTEGNLVCVAGDLGKALIGFTALERKEAGFDVFKEAFLKPKALVQEGQWFGTQQGVTAMMDISDGLFVDLKRLCEASKVAAEINLNYLSITEEFKMACQHLKLDPLSTQVSGGEDYSLLLCVKSDQYLAIERAFKEKFGYGLKSIGHLTKGFGVSFFHDGQPKALTLHPFSHFGEF
jgi:thiamine-monophosphate kinase